MKEGSWNYLGWEINTSLGVNGHRHQKLYDRGMERKQGVGTRNC